MMAIAAMAARVTAEIPVDTVAEVTAVAATDAAAVAGAGIEPIKAIRGRSRSYNPARVSSAM